MRLERLFTFKALIEESRRSQTTEPAAASALLEKNTRPVDVAAPIVLESVEPRATGLVFSCGCLRCTFLVHSASTPREHAESGIVETFWPICKETHDRRQPPLAAANAPTHLTRNQMF